MKEEIKISFAKNGLKVPSINDIYLHSTLDPNKEAHNFALQQIDRCHSPNVLVLGLGFGYHITAIKNLLIEKFGTANIAVLEPNEALINNYRLSEQDQQFTIYQYEVVEDAYFDERLINFLLLKPTIISHNNSFNLNKIFYTGFLSFRASEEYDNYSNCLSSTIKDRINQASSEAKNFDESINFINQKNKLDSNDFYLLTLNAIKNAHV
jgi:hypothetical protein